MGKVRLPSSRIWLTPHQLRNQNSHIVFKICSEACRHSDSVLPQVDSFHEDNESQREARPYCFPRRVLKIHPGLMASFTVEIAYLPVTHFNQLQSCLMPSGSALWSH